MIGGLEWFGLKRVGPEPGQAAPTIPHLTFMVFQLMFAVITVALITGSIAERMKFSAFLLFAVLWSTFIYSPLAHWVWGGRWLSDDGWLGEYMGGGARWTLQGGRWCTSAPG